MHWIKVYQHRVVCLNYKRCFSSDLDYVEQLFLTIEWIKRKEKNQRNENGE